MLRKIAAGFALGAFAAAITLVLAWMGGLEEAELSTYDWRIRASADPAAVRQDIVLVEVNDTSIRDFAPVLGRWPWPRVVFARLAEYLGRGPARVIAFDFAFLEPDVTLGVQLGTESWSGAKSDAALAEALRRLPATTLIADAVYEGVKDRDDANPPPDWRPRSWPFRLGPAIEERPFVVPPFDPLMQSVTLLGHDFVPLDLDGPARRIPPFIRQGDHYMPSLGIAAALLAGGYAPEDVSLEGEAIRVGDRRIPLVAGRVHDAAGRVRSRPQLTTLINYKAPPLVNGRRPFRTYEARHLIASIGQLDAGETPEIDPSEFKDKIVFVGLSASALVDVFTTPFGADSGNMPGMQLHATMADNLLSNRFIRPGSEPSRLWSVIAAGLFVGLMAALLPFAGAAAGTAIAMAAFTSYALSSFRGGVWLNLSQPVLTMAVALFAGTAYRFFVEGYQKRLVKTLFGRYVSRDVFRQLMDHPELAELGGRRREMTVLFSDIRGFTSLTERGQAEALVAQLNEYFSKMVEVVFRHHGTVDKFVGDMVMALFGAPVDDADHAEHAVAAAVEMVSSLQELNRKWSSEGKVTLDIGIGVNSGDMIAGNIGSSSIMSYTVIGDHVNLGSRLESLNKEYGTRIIISDATRSRLSGAYPVRPLGDVIVKGKTRPVAIFEVVVLSPIAMASGE